MSINYIEYPALIYKSGKSNTYVANCITKKLVGYVHTEEDAVNNLESVLNQMYSDYSVIVKPVRQFLPNIASV